jgi:hypothetical protein
MAIVRQVGDGQKIAHPQMSGGIDWEDGDSFRQDRELRRRAIWKGR